MTVPSTKFTFSAPGRCGIAGNPTDMYGGSVISCSTRERATVTVEDNDILEIVVGGNLRSIRNPQDFRQDGGMFDAVLAALEYFELRDALLRITVVTEIPVRAGLAGSTAMLTSLVAALLEWMNAKGCLLEGKSAWSVRAYNNSYMLAETVRHIELYFLKIVCGYQDAYMSTFGSLRFLDFRGKENYLSLAREPLGSVEDLAPFSPPLPIVLAHTGVQRVSGSVHKPIRDRWLEGDPLVVEGIFRIAHIARMAKRAILSGDWDLLGEAMTENHEIVRSFGSSSEINEKIIRIALDSGAISAKLAGAGNGGTIIALHPEPEKLAGVFREKGVGLVLFPEPAEGVRREKD